MKKFLSIFLCLMIISLLVGCKGVSIPDREYDEIKESKEIISMEHIWQLTDPNDFVIAMLEHLDQKTQYGQDMSALNAEERIFYITQTLEMEVNNGGFSQFFYNSSGNFSNEVVSAFQAIGANTTAAICKKALSAFGCEIPVDRDAREKMLDELGNDEINGILEECDNAFYDYIDNLNELNHKFVMKNNERFT